MKKIGNLDISFKEYKDNVYYYDVKLEINGKQVSIVLPRYHTFLGWVEVFGLPPQNEWVVLDTLTDFEKNGFLKIGDNEVKETVKYTTGKNSHTIQTTRKLDSEKEFCIWNQSYSNAPEEILSDISFQHNNGEYKTTWKTEILKNDTNLSNAEQNFVSDVKNKHGQYDVLIRKTFTASGSIPSIYYSLFPIQDLLDLTNISGSVIEIGYLNKNSQHKVDNVHGDWCKRFDFGSKRLYINETNYSSCEIETDKGVEQIKNTYKKELFSD